MWLCLFIVDNEMRNQIFMYLRFLKKLIMFISDKILSMNNY